MTNPLLDATLPTPAFDRIQPQDFMPAIETLISEAREKFEYLKNNESTPSFSNTAVPLESLFEDINRVGAILRTYYQAATGPEIIAVYEEVSKSTATFKKDIFQDAVISARFQAVYNSRDRLPLDDQDRRVLKNIYDTFEDNGAFLDPAQKDRVRAIEQELIGLCNKFNTNLKDSAQQQAVLFTDSADLRGVPEAIVTEMKAKAVEAGHAQGWLYAPERLQVDALLEMAESCHFRESIFKALNRMGTQVPLDNEPLVQDITRLRHEYARILGYDHYADMALSRTMAGSWPRVQGFLQDVSDKLLHHFEKEVKIIQEYADKNGGPARLEPWDLPYWSARYKSENLSFDSAKFSEYLDLDRAMDGFFAHAGRLFDIDFQQISYPVYHPDVRTYEVRDKADGALRGVLYVDLYARSGTKEGGAWMDHIHPAGGNRVNTVTFNLNHAKPEPGKSCLISVDEAETLFHEGGHALHGLLGTKTKYKSLQGPGISSDFLEIHSMTMENWVTQRACLDTFAIHHQTGTLVPEDLFSALKKSSSWMAAQQALKIVQNALWDFAVHTGDTGKTPLADIQARSMMGSTLADHVRPYPLPRFSHLFSSPTDGYAAGYYGYLWSMIHKSDAFVPFRADPYDQQAASRLKAFYERGSSGDPNCLYEDYRGGPATFDAFMTAMGADEADTKKKPAGPDIKPVGP